MCIRDRYYKDHRIAFDAKVVDIFANLKEKNLRNIVILDQSVFYPTSGGQANDLGSLEIEGQVYNVVNAEKVGKCVLHILDKPLEKETSHYKGQAVKGMIDGVRRQQLRNHHTATHIVFAACRKVLGPHVWQNGAKKTVEQAHLDITHFTSLTKEEELEIENTANRTILANKSINKFFMDKAQAEKEYGFRLYQGGIVPGNQLRVVRIDDTDVEACCGTHCDNTSEVGWIKLLKTKRISDGIVRLYFVAGEKSIERLNKEREVLNHLCKIWSVNQGQLVETGERFFKDYKKLSGEVDENTKAILNLQVKYAIDSGSKLAFIRSKQENATVYFSFMPGHAPAIKDKNKAVIYLGEKFIFGLLAQAGQIDLEKLKALLAADGKKVDIKTRKDISFQTEKKENIKVTDILQFTYIGPLNTQQVVDFLKQSGYEELNVQAGHIKYIKYSSHYFA
eukprot:TRINITY_DN2078_c0_g1_i2.p2 TRINITY_DN2078_c0_g1~~TRINITY_DN2078_c0_g1_i2.p2  ORF type:complete len:450 (+),score=222.70 TRINITY_DN2078_c0_g1_i2:66-1415(+)